MSSPRRDDDEVAFRVDPAQMPTGIAACAAVAAQISATRATATGRQQCGAAALDRRATGAVFRWPGQPVLQETVGQVVFQLVWMVTPQ